jgi:hypothetical protein
MRREQTNVLGLNAAREQFVEEPQLRELTYGVWKQIEANTKRLDFFHRFEHPTLDTHPVKLQSQTQSAYASTDDNYVHIPTDRDSLITRTLGQHAP